MAAQSGSLRSLALPVPERSHQLGPRLLGKVLFVEPANHLCRLPHLFEVRRAPVATRDVLFETEEHLCVEGAFEVIGHELDELLAGQSVPLTRSFTELRASANTVEYQGRSSTCAVEERSAKYGSTLWRTEARARWRSTRWFPGVSPSASDTSDES